MRRNFESETKIIFCTHSRRKISDDRQRCRSCWYMNTGKLSNQVQIRIKSYLGLSMNFHIFDKLLVWKNLIRLGARTIFRSIRIKLDVNPYLIKSPLCFRMQVDRNIQPVEIIARGKLFEAIGYRLIRQLKKILFSNLIHGGDIGKLRLIIGKCPYLLSCNTFSFCTITGPQVVFEIIKPLGGFKQQRAPI